MSDQNFVPLIVIPTRNRSCIAVAAAKSVLAEPYAHLNIWVSDNSTDTNERDQLREYCHSAGDARLRYITPPEPMSMGKHWEWIITQALAEKAVTHVGFLTDRMIFVPNALRSLIDIAVRHPQSLIAYPNDHLDDLNQPVQLTQNEWTGRVLEIDSATFIDHLLKVGWSPAFPRMLNCLTPTSLFGRLQSFYGDVLEAISPDICFGFRALEREQSFLYLDRPLIVDYAIARSNGHSATRGQATKDHKDFMNQLDQRGMNYAAPVPGLTGAVNAIFHEYNLVRASSQSLKLKPVNLGEYFTLIERDVRRLEDPVERAAQESAAAEYRKKYLASGELRNTDLLKAALTRAVVLEKISPAYLCMKLAKKLSRKFPRWNALWRRLATWANAGVYVAGRRTSEWPTTSDALAYISQHPLPRSEGRSVYEFKVAAHLVDAD